MGTWKAWKSKTGKAIKKFFIYLGIAIGSVILLAIVYRVSIGLYKKSLEGQIAKVKGQLAAQNVPH